MGGGCADRRMLYEKLLWLGGGCYGMWEVAVAGEGCGGSAVGGGFMVVVAVVVLGVTVLGVTAQAMVVIGRRWLWL